MSVKEWMGNIIKEEEDEKFLEGGKDFINDEEIEELLQKNRNPEPQKVRDIIAKSLSLERLEPEETATLLNVEDEDLWEEMYLSLIHIYTTIGSFQLQLYRHIGCPHVNYHHGNEESTDFSRTFS